MKAITGIILTAMLGLLAPQTVAQPYPSKTIRLIVPYAAGGATDIVARAIAQQISGPLGQQVIVDNKPGGAKQIGTELVAHSPPDGYTLLMVPATSATNPYLYAKLPYDINKDLVPIVLATIVPAFLIVNADLPVHSVKELVAYAKANPGKVSFASAGNGSVLHLGGEWFKMLNGLDVAHIPYKGSAPAVTDLVGGQVQFSFENLPPAQAFIKAGKLRMLAQATLQRMPGIPDVPTMQELGYPGFDCSAFFGVMAPAGTPASIVQRLNIEINKALANPEVRERLLAQGAIPVGGTPEALTEHIRKESVKWGKIIKDSGARPD
jgi:tripartite-type tricarboxylate transporter receptor subunit TctC